METSNRIIQGLWIGPELSTMEQLSISSFLINGHEYQLYTYGEVKNIPAGTIVKDGNEILPAASIFQYTHQPSYAGFANFFRYKLLLERGGWWTDTDVICLKPFDFPEEQIFATEICRGEEVVTSGIIKAPKGSPAMAYAWDVCQSKQPGQLVWGETGPRLMGETVTKFSLEEFRKPSHVFCPIGFADWHKVVEPESRVELEGAYAIHLWNERWRATGQDKNAEYPENCLYEQLKRQYFEAKHPTLRVMTQTKNV